MVSGFTVSVETLRKLATWALGRDCAIPDHVLSRGPSAIIAWGIEQVPDSSAARFWMTARSEAGQAMEPEAAEELLRFHAEDDWRHGWAVAALRAIDDTPPLNSPGHFLALGYARMRLTFAQTLVDCLGKGLGDERSSADTVEGPLSLEHSPFGEPAVQDVLQAIDVIVALQEQEPSRVDVVMVDMGVSSYGFMRRAYDFLKENVFQHYDGEPPRPFGHWLSSLLRYFSEQAERKQHIDLVRELNDPILTCAARYGTTSDYLMAVHRSLMALSRLSPGTSGNNSVLVLDNARLAAEWLGDPSAEAAVNHGLFLMMRDFVRKAPGIVDGLGHVQRAIVLRRQLGESIRALGAQVDMTSLLIQWGPLVSIGVVGRRTPQELIHWDQFAEMYLQDAIEQLAAFEDDPEALAYLGEAYHNRARLHEQLKRSREAGEDALACAAIAQKIGDDDLLARARSILNTVVDDPQQALLHGISAVQLLQNIRRHIEDEETAVSYVRNKERVFELSLRSILSAAGQGMGETRACELLLTSLEAGRGLTYNRWLGVQSVERLVDVQRLLAADESSSILAIYVVTLDQVGVVILDGDSSPRLQLIAMTEGEAEELVSAHFRGLEYHRRLRGSTLWPALQPEFTSRGWPLVEPLEPYVSAGRPICIVPHRSLHGAAFHTLPTSPDGVPIGLRAPLFQNPSVTNWIAAKKSDVAFSERAFVARTAPEDELDQFSEIETVSKVLTEAGIRVRQPQPEQTSLHTLSPKEMPWLVLHLACHGIFTLPGPEAGLLLARDGALPPAFNLRGGINDTVRNHLAMPSDLRKAGIANRLTFLASCLSARNEEYPGDDLMGVTRSFFASGTVDLIAGAWTVVSSIALKFIGHFYQDLMKEESRPADAILSSRKAVAADHPDPFHWGVFVHMGANSRIMTRGQCNAHE